MKNRYQRMDKEEKLKIRNKFKTSERGLALMPRLNRLIIIGLLGFATIGFLMYLEFFKEHSIWNYIWSGLLLIFSSVFIIGSLSLRGKEYNKQALKEPIVNKDKNKKK